MAALIASLDPGFGQASRRLMVACLLSAALHLALLAGVPVNPTGGAPGFTASTIYARLEPASPQAAEVQPQQPSVLVDSAGKPVVEAPAAEAVEKKPAPQPESRPAVAEPPPSLGAGLEIPLIRDPTYYAAKQLDAYPEPLAPIRLHYPETAVADRVDGRLLLLVLIDESGIVTDVAAVEAEPSGYFEEAARSVFRATRFKPGMKQGRAVKSRVLVQIRYVYGDPEGAVR